MFSEGVHNYTTPLYLNFFLLSGKNVEVAIVMYLFIIIIIIIDFSSLSLYFLVSTGAYNPPSLSRSI